VFFLEESLLYIHVPSLRKKIEVGKAAHKEKAPFFQKTSNGAHPYVAMLWGRGIATSRRRESYRFLVRFWQKSAPFFCCSLAVLGP
jgi:hypothetical protein